MAEDLPALATALRQAEDEGVVDVVGTREVVEVTHLSHCPPLSAPRPSSNVLRRVVSESKTRKRLIAGSADRARGPRKLSFPEKGDAFSPQRLHLPGTMAE